MLYSMRWIGALVALVFVGNAAAVEWNVSVWGKRRAFTENVEKLSELVAQRSGGKFKLNISYGGLSKPKENLDGIAIGAFEMAQFCSFYHTEKNPSITVTELPFSRNLSLARIAEIQDAVHKHPIVVKDLARWNATLLMPTPLPQYNIVGKGKAVKALDDFKGMRVRGPGGIMGVLGSYGAIKTGVPFPEVGQAMGSGVIDGAAFAPHAHLATKTFRKGQWATTNLNLGTANCPVVVNTDALKSLSKEHRKILMDAVPDALAYYVSNYDNNISGKYGKTLKDAGLTMVTFTPDQVKALNKRSKKISKDWVNKYQKDFNAKKLYKFTKKQFNK